jgi:hypothetical protein
MRWLFLLLLVLNGVYAIWHQQEAPSRPMQIQALSMNKNAQQDIRLLSESAPTGAATAQVPSPSDCLYLGGSEQRLALAPVQQRLTSLGVRFQAQAISGDQGAIHWLRIDRQSQRLLDETALQTLVRDFSALKHQIMPCEGIATSE